MIIIKYYTNTNNCNHIIFYPSASSSNVYNVLCFANIRALTLLNNQSGNRLSDIRRSIIIQVFLKHILVVPQNVVKRHTVKGLL